MAEIDFPHEQFLHRGFSYDLADRECSGTGSPTGTPATSRSSFARKRDFLPRTTGGNGRAEKACWFRPNTAITQKGVDGIIFDYLAA
jgi:hypothetical protein